MQYSISSGFFVKTSEVTKLTPFPISNETDFFWAIVPSVSSNLPTDVLFLQEAVFVPPHSTVKFEPKLVKIGSVGFASTATRVENGLSVDILIIEGLDITKTEKTKSQRKTTVKEKPREKPASSITDRIDAILMERENHEESVKKSQEKSRSIQEDYENEAGEKEKKITEPHSEKKVNTKAQKPQESAEADSSLLDKSVLEFARTEIDKM